MHAICTYIFFSLWVWLCMAVLNFSLCREIPPKGCNVLHAQLVVRILDHLQSTRTSFYGLMMVSLGSRNCIMEYFVTCVDAIQNILHQLGWLKYNVGFYTDCYWVEKYVLNAGFFLHRINNITYYGAKVASSSPILPLLAETKLKTWGKIDIMKSTCMPIGIIVPFYFPHEVLSFAASATSDHIGPDKSPPRLSNKNDKNPTVFVEILSWARIF